jgi:hypothetical protein
MKKINPLKIFNTLSRLSFIAFSLFSFSASNLLFPFVAKAESQVLAQTFDAADVKLPDWTNISFSSLGGVLEGGEYQDRTWQAGDSLDRILKLDDITEDFAPHKFKVGQILDLGEVNLNNVSLEDFPLVGKQTLSQLVAAVPELGDLLPTEVAPIAELLEAEGLLSTLGVDGVVPTLSQLVQDNIIGELSLNQIDLGEFGIDSIPNLDLAVLEDFANWEGELIGAIPGLAQVPLAMMPIPLLPATGAIARIDGVWSKYESNKNRTISGSNVEGFNVLCEQNCAHIELDDLENEGESQHLPMEGVQWISGKYQWVDGGSGCLAGAEPTGRHPFGKGFKVVVWEPKESFDTVNTKIFFRFKILCGKSPYIIGPFPFLEYKVNELIYLGTLDPGSLSFGTSIEVESIWQWAIGEHPQPSSRTEGVDNCLRGYYWREYVKSN